MGAKVEVRFDCMRCDEKLVRQVTPKPAPGVNLGQATLLPGDALDVPKQWGTVNLRRRQDASDVEYLLCPACVDEIARVLTSSITRPREGRAMADA